jgi:putative hydrolase of the HAD superfamily
VADSGRILAILFDAVGTLILLREPVGATYARSAARRGVRLPASRLDDAFARVLAAAGPNVHPGVPRAEVAERERAWWRARVRETFRAADGMARFDDFEACFAELWQHYAGAEAWRLAPGAREGLEALAARGLRLGVLSNFDQRLPGILRALDLEAYFDAVTLPADAGAAKPAPAIFAVALARLGVPADRALYVGDHAEQDLAAAAGAGLHALDVGTLPDLGALPKALDRLEGELS